MQNFLATQEYKNFPKRPKKRRWIGSVLLAMVSFGGFLYWHTAAQSDNNKSSEIVTADFSGIVKGDQSEYATVETVLPVAQYHPVRKSGAADATFPAAHASVILDAESGSLLHYENGREHRSVASLTKIMTALLVVENISDISEPVTITAASLPSEGTVVGCPRSDYCISSRLRAGERLTAGDLLTAILINSTNDAASALAVHISGSEEAFVEKMNRRAYEIGARDTHFCTASGLEPEGREDECYSSAYDVARITVSALGYEKIWERMLYPTGTVITSTDGSVSHELINTNELLGQYPGLLGTKTGFTPNAGRSLLAAAQDPSGKHTIVAVFLDDPYRWGDIKDALGWAFSSYRWE